MSDDKAKIDLKACKALMKLLAMQAHLSSGMMITVQQATSSGGGTKGPGVGPHLEARVRQLMKQREKFDEIAREIDGLVGQVLENWELVVRAG